jgi:hypothetical protein
MEETECSEKSAHKIQTSGNHPKHRIQHSQDGESLLDIFVRITTDQQMH